MNTHQYVFTRNTPSGKKTYPIPLSTRLILEAAEKLGVSWTAIEDTYLIELQYGDHIERFHYQIPSTTSATGLASCTDKTLTHNILKKAGVSCPKQFFVSASSSESDKREVFNALTKPLVVKPSHGSQGWGVHINIDSFEKFLSAIDTALLLGKNIEDSGAVIEETASGNEYRLIGTKQGCIAALYRKNANVVGDGEHTIEELVKIKNNDPRRGETLDYALFHIHIKEEDEALLTQQGHSKTSVPKTGEVVLLKRVSNIMQGGDSIDITDDIHPSVANIVKKVMLALPGVGFAGIDLMTTSIFTEQTSDSYSIIEVNTSPGICIHELPFSGKARGTTFAFIESMFPETHALASTFYSIR